MRKKKKSVQWQPQDRLEEIKYFKMNDEPNARGLTIDEVLEIQSHLVDVPPHMIQSAIQKIEMKLDRKLLEERKDIECQQRKKLDEMKPRIKYPYRLPCKYYKKSPALINN